LEYFLQWFSDDFWQRFLDVLLQRPSDAFSQWLSDIAKGDNEAFRKLWDGYFLKMVSLSQNRFWRQGIPEGAFDGEDAAMAAMREFYEEMVDGKFPNISNREELQKELFTINKRKVIWWKRRCAAQKRGGGWVQVHEKSSPKKQLNYATIAALGLEVQFDDKQSGLNGLLHRRQLIPEQAASYNDDFIRRLKQLPDDTHRLIMLMIVAKFSVQEIADGLGCVRQTVYNKHETIGHKKLDYMPMIGMPTIDPERDVMNDAIQEYQSQLVLTEDDRCCLSAKDWLKGDTLQKMTKELREILKSSATHLDASQFFEE
jgi:DNA-directed RNA polymerase specialized sigma24 family protein